MSVEMIIAILEAVGARDFLINAFKRAPQKEWTKQEILDFIRDANAREDDFDAQFTEDDI